MPVIEHVLNQMEEFIDFDPQYAIKCIESNRHNKITATYHLIHKKLLKSNKVFSSRLVCGSLDRTYGNQS